MLLRATTDRADSDSPHRLAINAEGNPRDTSRAQAATSTFSAQSFDVAEPRLGCLINHDITP
jgi:hypothetical protein